MGDPSRKIYSVGDVSECGRKIGRHSFKLSKFIVGSDAQGNRTKELNYSFLTLNFSTFIALNWPNRHLQGFFKSFNYDQLANMH